MYNATAIRKLVGWIESYDGVNDKAVLSRKAAERFDLTVDRKVFYCRDYAIRFCKAKSGRMSNTVLSLSALQKYDDRPFFVCIVTASKNYLLLANTTFLKKISHSSRELRVNNIRGSFNGSDILREINGIRNGPPDFEELFAFHQGFTFEENLERLVEATNRIVGTGKRFAPTAEQLKVIMEAPERAVKFRASLYFADLENDLRERVERARNEIAIAALIDNVNVRGRVIEYLISSNPGSLRDRILESLRNEKPIPEFKTKDGLGDYSKAYPGFVTETDIKTKVLFLSGNPKAYNVDKLLEFLSEQESGYLIFIVGIDGDRRITTRLCSVFEGKLLAETHVLHHWAGRNSRGVAQFTGTGLSEMLSRRQTDIDPKKAGAFLKTLLKEENDR